MASSRVIATRMTPKKLRSDRFQSYPRPMCWDDMVMTATIAVNITTRSRIRKAQTAPTPSMSWAVFVRPNSVKTPRMDGL